MKKIIILLFYLLFFLFPLGLIGRIKLSQNVFVTPQDIIVAFIFFITITYRFIKKTNYKPDNFLRYQLLFAIFGVLSLVANSLIFHDINFPVSLLYAIRYIVYLNLLTIGPLWSDIKNIRLVIIMSGAVTLIVGFIQFFFYNNLQNLFYLGWDNHLYRLFSSFLDPNYAGVFFVVYSFFLLSIVIREPFRRVYFHLIVAFFSLVAIYITYSRTALIALASGVVTFGIVKRKFKFIVIVLSILVFLVFLTSDTSVEGLNPLRTASTSERVKSMKEAVFISLQNPIFGVGFNAYRYAQVRIGARTTLGASISNADAGTDNSMFFVLATTGMIGLVLFVLSYYQLLKTLYDERKLIGYGLYCIAIALLVGSLFLNVMFYTPILTYFFVLISLRKSLFTTRGM